MPSSFFGLTVAYSGLNASQASINTTANNISNVQTKGYSKQVVNLTASSALRCYQRYGSTGTGVTADSVTQLRDEYYDEKYWNNQATLGLYEKKLYYMEQIQNYYTDGTFSTTTSSGFSTIYAKMFNALDAVKTNAGSSASRNEFLSTAGELCTYFNSTAQQLQSLQTSINDEIKTTVDNVNSIAKKISMLNKQINIIEMEGGHANELRDQRATLVDELSKIVPTKVEEKKEEAVAEITDHEPEISFDDFCKVELRVAEVRACENLKESKKLLHLTVFDGERERCILSGIAKWFKPEDLIGKKLGIVCNLAPRPMLKGKYVSEGMIFAADTADGGCSIAFYGDDTPVGSRIH